jgi:hypothetical protein
MTSFLEDAVGPVVRQLKAESVKLMQRKRTTVEAINRWVRDLGIARVQHQFLDDSWIVLEGALDAIELAVERRTELEDIRDADLAALELNVDEEDNVLMPLSMSALESSASSSPSDSAASVPARVTFDTPPVTTKRERETSAQEDRDATPFYPRKSPRPTVSANLTPLPPLHLPVVLP